MSEMWSPPGTTLPSVHRHSRRLAGLADVTPPLLLPSWRPARLTCFTAGELAAGAPHTPVRENKTMAARARLCRRVFVGASSGTQSGKLFAQRPDGSTGRPYSSATHKENELELGGSTLSAPTNPASLKTRSRQVMSTHRHCPARLFTVHRRVRTQLLGDNLGRCVTQRRPLSTRAQQWLNLLTKLGTTEEDASTLQFYTCIFYLA